MTIAVVDSTWIANGQELFVTTAGYFLSNGKPDGTHVTLYNEGVTGNVAPGTVITNPQQVGPAGKQGLSGVVVGASLNSISPTIQKADILADNGANSPSASVVRLGVGTNGQALVADSTQPTGLAYRTITPNSVTSGNDIPRFSGASGTPTPLKDSGLLITDDGAIQSTPTGGNARGVKAIDLQVSRTANANVASGQTSVVAGGADNKASGTNATVAGGDGNAATGNNSFVGGGNANSATANVSTVGGGQSNTAGGNDATVAGGLGNSAGSSGASVGGGTGNNASGSVSTVGGGTGGAASGTASTISGGQSNAASGDYSAIQGGNQAIADKYGQRAFSAGSFSANGDAQTSELTWRNSTTDATPTELFLDGASLRATVPLNKTWGGKVTLVGRSSVGVCAVWECSFGIQNNAATVSMVAVATATVTADGTGTTWGVAGGLTLTADNVNKSLKLTVTGAVATSIRWCAMARFVDIGF